MPACAAGLRKASGCVPASRKVIGKRPPLWPALKSLTKDERDQLKTLIEKVGRRPI